jgi:hypothetical protein
MSLADTTGGGGGGGDGSSALDAVQGLIASLSVSVLGYNFIENPEGFILATIYKAAVEGMLAAAAWLAFQFSMLWGILVDALESAGSAGTAPFRHAGSTVIDVLQQFDAVIVSAASMAGPAAPLVATAAWLAMVLVVVWVGRRFWGVLPWT